MCVQLNRIIALRLLITILLTFQHHQAGAFQPFMRAHAHLDTKRREPYLFDKEDMLLIRDAIRTRYTFLPLWYTIFHEAALTGAPVMRYACIDYTYKRTILALIVLYVLCILISDSAVPSGWSTHRISPHLTSRRAISLVRTC